MAEFNPEMPSAPTDYYQADSEQQAPKKEKQISGNKLTRNTSHPLMIIVYLLVKAYPLTFGLVNIFFRINQAVIYICQAVGIVLDFYTSKNLAGRYLAGIRWHTYVVEGKTYYYFESKDIVMSKLDKSVFWGGMWFSPIYYLAFTFADFFTFGFLKLPLDILGMFATGSNLIAYLRCSKDAKAKMKEMAQGVTKQAATAAVDYQMNQVMQ
ncbi:hypothetical protein SS50377_26887 [Spironucleus salmonicida]|uniref:Golgi apparatus membrane protein TVP23 homolog n=1 Tax=Spironucleus salmonicida TaxID=348837 RepID=V6M2D4_9EUKA|nr:hypothetical protein SS50377_26887 [Spironucleus salmonicida]|eukprot:EST47399.1 Transmembrane domain-containing protein [Spironucleus salmonicida]